MITGAPKHKRMAFYYTEKMTPGGHGQLIYVDDYYPAYYTMPDPSGGSAADSYVAAGDFALAANEQQQMENDCILLRRCEFKFI